MIMSQSGPSALGQSWSNRSLPIHFDCTLPPFWFWLHPSPIFVQFIVWIIDPFNGSCKPPPKKNCPNKETSSNGPHTIVLITLRCHEHYIASLPTPVSPLVVWRVLSSKVSYGFISCYSDGVGLNISFKWCIKHLLVYHICTSIV